jgi:hypothetical protein
MFIVSSSFPLLMISLKELIHKRKKSQSTTQSENSRFGFFHRYLSASLIFILFLSQTVQVSFFDRADANADDYRDIVSVIVDEDTYNQLRPKIRRYAEDIQWYLKATRVNILVTPADIRPEVIAAHNEKLYYEGDGKAGISSLIGTILIGNVPLPIVHKEGISVPSLYPYVDFDDKRFTYNEKEKKYLFQRDAPESSDVEIWHGKMLLISLKSVIFSIKLMIFIQNQGNLLPLLFRHECFIMMDIMRVRVSIWRISISMFFLHKM